MAASSPLLPAFVPLRSIACSIEFTVNMPLATGIPCSRQTLEIPEEVEISKELIEDERPQLKEHYNPHKRRDEDAPGPAFHEKSEKNQKENLGGSYQRIIAKKYKKPQTRGDKNYNRRNKK